MAIVIKLIFALFALYFLAFITVMGFPYFLTIVLGTLLMTWIYKFPNDLINGFCKKIINKNDKNR